MRKAAEKKPRKRTAWIAAALIAVAVLSGIGFLREFLRSRQIDDQIAALRTEADRLQVRNFQVSSLAASLQSGEYLEREARMKLGLQKEGEQAVVLRKDGAGTMAELGAAPDAGVERGWSNVRKWWTLFADPPSYKAYVRAQTDAAG